MVSLLALLPCAAVVLAVLLFRLSGLTAAAIALGVALALWLLGVFSPLQLAYLGNSIVDSLILELLVGVVIVAGILFVEVSSRGGAFESISAVIQALSLAPSRAAILITVGIGVMLESLTGYGVSMLVTVPLLLQLVGRVRAIGLALIGMSLMSWGALSVAALLGAELAGLSTQAFAGAILTTSGPIAFVLPILCTVIVPNSNVRDFLFAVVAGATLTVGIVLTSFAVGVEVAGVGGGLAVILLCVIAGNPSTRLFEAATAPPLWPYGLLMVAVVLQKLSVPVLNGIGIAPVVSSGRVSFYVLASPAIALFSVSLLALVLFRTSAHGSDIPLMQHVIRRAWRALTSVFLFLLTARLLVETGAVSALAGALSQLGIYPAIATVTLLGGLGAYVTGSGVTSNALFMPSAASTGENLDALALFAALQHSGAAHVAIASLPLIAILLAALPQRRASDERDAMKTALSLAGVWLILVIGSGWAQVAMF